MKNFFVVLGGMGTMATESFVSELNLHTKAHSDQEYLNYIVMNHASIPDRTAYILDNNNENPFNFLKEDILQTSKLNPDFFVITCNTAHYFYEELTKLTNIPIKHMPKIAVKKCSENAKNNNEKVMILATTGTINSGVYTKVFEEFENLKPVIPNEELQEEVMKLIYQDIKENNYLNKERYLNIIKTATEKYNCSQIILGCTELSLMQEKHPINDYNIVDAQFELVRNILAEYHKLK